MRDNTHRVRRPQQSARLGCQAKILFGLADPAAQGGVTRQIEAALRRQPRVGQQRHVCERDGLAQQKTCLPKLIFHTIERGVATP